VTNTKRSDKSEKAVIGWREWVALPDLGISWIKAKVDTGARTSSLHAFEPEVFRRKGEEWVRFEVHPEQRSGKNAVIAEQPIVEWRHVKPSSGKAERRPVILTTVELLDLRREVEVTLTRRDEMGFRMLLGRQATRGFFIVDPGRSYAGGRRPRPSKKKKKRKKARQ